jgi:hypothetical protein
LFYVEWEEEAVAKAEILRLIYQGRFLHSNVTLGALGLPLSKTTVMHLVPRENLPEPNSQGELQIPHHISVGVVVEERNKESKKVCGSQKKAHFMSNYFSLSSSLCLLLLLYCRVS